MNNYEEEKYDKLWQELIELRLKDKPLNIRIMEYSECIHLLLATKTAASKSLIDRAVRESTEVKRYMDTADTMTENARKFMEENGIPDGQKSKEIYLRKEDQGTLRHEHPVPVNTISLELIGNNSKYNTPEKIKELLIEYGIRCIMMNDENKKIDKGYKISMPENWDFTQNPFARYKNKNLKIQKKEKIFHPYVNKKKPKKI